MTAGTNQKVTWSTSIWIGSLPPWASSTMRMIWASMVSPPTLVARKLKLPDVLSVPPTTLGADVLADRQRLARNHRFVDIGRAFDHLAIDGDLLAGADDDDVAGHDLLDGRCSTILPSRSTRAVLACSRTSRWIASPVRPLARASSKRPTRISVTMTAAAS